MPELRLARRAPAACLALAVCLVVLPGCFHAGAGLRTVEIGPDEIVTRDRSAELALPAPMPIAERPADAVTPSRFEAAYARDTARILFKRRDGERGARFLPGGMEDGYRLCLRAGGRHVLLVFQRRILEAGLSQAADDVVILRGDADTAPCRRLADYVPAA